MAMIMKTAEDLRTILRQIDRKSYPAYKDTKGKYRFPEFVLSIDHVQGDPFASPSKVSIWIPGEKAGFSREYYEKKHRRIALEDYLLRQFGKQTEKVSFRAKGSGKSGLITVSHCGQEILNRTACQIEPESGNVVVRVEIGFPANGRTINAKEMEKIIFDLLQECVSRTLYAKRLDANKLAEVIHLADDQQYIREQLPKLHLVAFVADGSILPRETGVSGRPMKDAVPFVSPDSMEVYLDLPYRGRIRGMGVKKGITLIVGGGYHGKSTLLKALEQGIYQHIAGDGREYVITDETAVKIRAEDGRSIQSVDISMFINDLPNGKDTHSFCTQDASGSTSQAAAVIESLEAGSRVLLMDEDTSATNFMIRDELMQKVVHKDAEPITPFIDRIEALYRRYGISTILVAGSFGAYFHKADCILQMKQYVPLEITKYAKEEASHYPILANEIEDTKMPGFERYMKADKAGHSSERTKIKIMGKDAFSIDRETVDLRYVEQLVDTEQIAALAHLLKYAKEHLTGEKFTVGQAVERLWALLEEKGFEAVCDGYISMNMVYPRKQEIFACFNRYRDW